MAERYVAFLDLLGFKGQVAGKTQEESEEMIVEFANTVHEVWERYNKGRKQELIKAMLASDSVIVYTLEQAPEELDLLLQFSLALMREVFERNSNLLRGAVSKGGFMEVRNPGTRNFKETLMVGQAYVSAYTLEGQYKTSTLQMHENVRDDIVNGFGQKKYPVDLVDAAEGVYSLRWGDMEYISDLKTLAKFVRMASESDWRPHYYNTLYSFMRRSQSAVRRAELFRNVMLLLAQGDPDAHWRRQDLFIQNAFNDKVDANFQRMFLEYLRNCTANSRPW